VPKSFLPTACIEHQGISFAQFAGSSPYVLGTVLSAITRNLKVYLVFVVGAMNHSKYNLLISPIGCCLFTELAAVNFWALAPAHRGSSVVLPRLSAQLLTVLRMSRSYSGFSRHRCADKQGLCNRLLLAKGPVSSRSPHTSCDGSVRLCSLSAS
jgi:hypothetical protein